MAQLISTSVPPLSASSISIISAEELRERLNSVVILDARSRSAVRLARIPGSLHVDWKNWAKERAEAFHLWFGKKPDWGLVQEPTDLLQNQLRKLGLSNSKSIVVVGEPHGWGEEGRVAWNLLYWGAEDVSMLDGGFPAWRSHPDYPVERGAIKTPQEGDFTLRPQPARRAVLEEVKTALRQKDRSLLDIRSEKEYSGKRYYGQKRGGHLPGAVFYSAKNLYQKDGRFIGKELLAEWKLDASSRPIAYCVGGVRSALFAMIWEARFGDVIANYDGSMWEWSWDPSLPLVSAAAEGNGR